MHTCRKNSIWIITFFSIFVLCNSVTFEQLFNEHFSTTNLKNSNIQSAVVVAVQNDQIIFASGYGDESGKTPDPSSSIYPLGFITTTFTGTAAMQLYEQGKIDLDEDVNTYLQNSSVKLSNTIYGNYESFLGVPKSTATTKITPAILMTHTSGLDVRFNNLEAKNTNEIQNLEDYLKSNLPPRIREANKISSVNSHEIALLGFIIEKISRIQIGQYFQKNIFDVLDMKTTYYGYENIPQDKMKNFIKPTYRKGDEKIIPEYWGQFSNIGPTNAIFTTAHDLANYIIAHLKQNSTFFKRNDTIKEIHKQHFTNMNGIPGMALTWMKGERNNVSFNFKESNMGPIFTKFEISLT